MPLQLPRAWRRPLAALVLTLPLAAQAASPTPPSWDTFVDSYIESFFKAHPAFAVVQGRHEFDGQLPDWSKEGIAREIARLKARRTAALAYPNSALNSAQQYQRDYLVAAIDSQLFWLDDAEWPFRSPDFYFSWLTDSIDPAAYITLTYAPPEERIKAFTRYANNIPTAVAQIRDNLRMPMPRTLLQYGIDSFGGFADFYRTDVAEAFASVSDKALLAEFDAAREKAARAMESLADYLQSQRASATEDYALGPELFRKMIYATERVDISLEELEAIGRADMARNQAALKAACADFAPGKSIPDCFAKMASRKPEGGSVVAARRQLDELKAFVIDKDLVTIPGKEEALVRESPPYARSNSAFINTAGPYEKDQPSIYYISPPNPAWPKEVQDAYIPGESDLLFTSAHEVWPGHFLNFVHANRADFTFGRVFVTYAFGEGWAHYTEEMMLEAGLREQSPETRIGQLGNALLRNARFLSAIGLHTQGMTIEESEKLFMEQAYQDKGTAEQQAARGTYDPAYLNYTLGKLLILQLREDWTKERGGRKAWRDFHDQFLSYGGPPIPLVRGQMLGTEPKAEFYREK
ncbi:DUF885 domain-containing protein [Parahaliea mediterranea]|uniref:DUF885 domain-containing protein n=1 Tax=Parahaliea mediterranea TaxID=651086 RepID=UPI0019D4A4AB|nr:DUF885 domain-containing protein [Parahaliea mediterranea]